MATWKYFLAVLAIGLFANAAQAQTLTPQEWGRQLRRNIPNEKDRAYAIYHWLTRNISYDWDAYYASVNNSVNTDQSPATVWKRRKAICEGFAALYQLLAAEAGLECVQVRGVAKGVHYQVGNEINRPDHAWNAVRIDGQWELVDATWGSGDGKNRLPNDTYFMIAPENLAFTHFPEEERWQLLARPLTLHEFERKPIVYPIFSKLQPQLLYNARELIIETSRDSLQIHLRTLPTAVLMAVVVNAEGQQREIRDGIRNRLGNVSILIDSLQRGQSYRLDIFAAASDTARELRQMLTYFINYQGSAKYATQPDSRIRVDSMTGMPTGFVQDYAALQQRKDYVGALALLNDYATRHGNNPWLHTAKGENLEQLMRFDEAETSYLQAIALQADDYHANYALGVLYYNRAVNLNESLRRLSVQEQQARGPAIKQQVRSWLAKAQPFLQTAYRKKPDDRTLEQTLRQIEQILK
jgi:hypothetical protein